MLAICPGCGGRFDARADAIYCSASCRQRAYRTRGAQKVTVLEQALEQTIVLRQPVLVNPARLTWAQARQTRHRSASLITGNSATIRETTRYRQQVAADEAAYLHTAGIRRRV